MRVETKAMERAMECNNEYYLYKKKVDLLSVGIILINVDVCCLYTLHMYIKSCYNFDINQVVISFGIGERGTFGTF